MFNIVGILAKVKLLAVKQNKIYKKIQLYNNVVLFYEIIFTYKCKHIT